MCSAVTFRPSGTLSGRWSLSRETCRRDCIERAIKCKLNRCKISVYQVRGAPYGWQCRSILLSYRHAQEVEHRRQCVLYELIRALLAAALVVLLPGWFWTRVLIPSSSSSSSDLYERLTYSLALSLALVPAIALIPTRLFGMGVSLSVTLVCVGIVFFSGLGASLWFGSGKGSSSEEVVGSSPHMLSILTLGLLAAAFGLGLGVVAVTPGTTPATTPKPNTNAAANNPRVSMLNMWGEDPTTSSEEEPLPEPNQRDAPSPEKNTIPTHTRVTERLTPIPKSRVGMRAIAGTRASESARE